MPEATFESTSPAMVKPPSQVIKEAFNLLKGKITVEVVLDLSKSTLLPPEEVRIWIDHLQTIQVNRKRGAEKAATIQGRERENVVAFAYAVKSIQT